MNHTYKDTNESLYEDIALWEKTEGIQFMKEMPLNGNSKPQILDFGFGFCHYLFAASSAFPDGTIYGIDGYPNCIKEVGDKITNLGITNIKIIGEVVENLSCFEDESMDMVLLYDTLHADFSKKKMLLEEAHRVLKKGGCLSALPFIELIGGMKKKIRRRTPFQGFKKKLWNMGMNMLEHARYRESIGKNVIPSTTFKKVRSRSVCWREWML